jgi:hypothetical protein
MKPGGSTWILVDRPTSVPMQVRYLTADDLSYVDLARRPQRWIPLSRRRRAGSR